MTIAFFLIILSYFKEKIRLLCNVQTRKIVLIFMD
jgi:hypothetical protein